MALPPSKLLTLEQHLHRYVDLIKKFFDVKTLKIILEPGRYISWNAGILVTKVLYIKIHGNKKFIITDCGMNDFMRPALYDGFHKIIPLIEIQSTENQIDPNLLQQRQLYLVEEECKMVRTLNF